MLNGVELTIVGNLTRDPELQFSGQGKAWVRFSVAVNRVTNRDGQKQEKVTFVNCKAFGDVAENIGASLKRGQRVIAYGRLEEESWQDSQSGQERKAMSFFVDEIGPSLRWAQTPEVVKTSGGGGGGRSGGYQGNQGGGQSAGGFGGQGNQGGSDGGFGSGQDSGLSSPSSDDNPFF